MLINPLGPISPLPPVTPVRPVAPQPTPLTAEALLALAAVAAAEVTDQLGRIAAQSGEAMAGPAGGASSTAATTTIAAATAAAVVPPEPEPTPVVLQARAVGAAAAQAAQRQGGLAPLMADLVAVRQAPTLPTPVRAALDQVLALRAPLDGAVTGADVKRALDRSGLFLEARLAAGVAPAERPGAGRAAERPGVPPPADMKAALLVFRQVVKTWLDAVPAAPAATPAPGAPAEASKTLAGPPTGVPTPALTAPPPTSAAMTPSPGLMTALRLPVLEPDGGLPVLPSATPPTTAPAAPAPAAAAPTTTATSSTPPVEADVVAPAPGAASPAPTAVAAQTSPALQTTPPPGAPELPKAFDAPEAPPHAQAPSPSAATPRPETSVATPRAAPEVPPASPALDAARPAPPAVRILAEPPAHAATPPPPYRDGPTSAQPAAMASLAANADAHAVAHHLLRETGAALARQELLQIASLPEPAPTSASGRPVEDKGARWMFDVPFMTPQGAAVAQFEISRDGGGGGAEYEARPVAATWRARFSLDVEPMGPVHAQIALSGERARVSLWAERPASMARLMAREPMLSSALREAELTPEVAFHAGAPQRAPAAPGKFVDQAS